MSPRAVGSASARVDQKQTSIVRRLWHRHTVSFRIHLSFRSRQFADNRHDLRPVAIYITSDYQSMKARNRFGVFSVCFGTAGLLAAIGVTEAERVRVPGFGHLLTWMDRLSLVRMPPSGQLPEWRPLGFFDLTDSRVLQWILVYSVCFAIWAMLMALLAEHQHEESSSAGLGFILGALALYVHGFEYGMSALFVGGTALVLIRRFTNPKRPPDLPPARPTPY